MFQAASSSVHRRCPRNPPYLVLAARMMKRMLTSSFCMRSLNQCIPISAHSCWSRLKLHSRANYSNSPCWKIQAAPPNQQDQASSPLVIAFVLLILGPQPWPTLLTATMLRLVMDLCCCLSIISYCLTMRYSGRLCTCDKRWMMEAAWAGWSLMIIHDNPW